MIYQEVTDNTVRTTTGYGITDGEISGCPRGYGNSRPPDREYQLITEHHLKTDASDAYHLMTSLGYPQFSMLG